MSSCNIFKDGSREKVFCGTGRYLWIPICDSEKKQELICKSGQEILWRFLVPEFSEDKEILFYAALFKERENVTLKGNFPEIFFELIQIKYERTTAVSAHPALHFAADNGWINDPNGLIEIDGLYHMYFQHNPVDTVWENMCWGHSSSSDLLHWKQLDDVLYPDENGTMFSGCAIENMGLPDLPTNALIFYYTCAGSTSKWSEGKPFTQNIAYSADGGKTLVKYETAVPQITDGNRDPKVYFYPARSLYYMVLFLENNGFAVLNSRDMLHFEVTQKFKVEGSGECPDLRKIPCGDGSEQWVFMQADGNYYIGDFDGSIFTPRFPLKNAYGTRLPYAAQTFNKPDDRVIHIAFLHVKSANSTYTNMMSLPRELSLIQKDSEYELQMKPVREYFAARRKTENTEYHYEQKHAVEIELYLGSARCAEISIGEIKVQYDRTSGRLSVAENEIAFDAATKCLHILIDKGVLEISPEDYVRPAYFEIDETMQQGKIAISNAEIYERITIYEI